jgi:hypothetical protein
LEEVKEIVKIDLPVGFGIRGEREVLSGLLSCNPGGEAPFVDASRELLEFALLVG